MPKGSRTDESAANGVPLRNVSTISLAVPLYADGWMSFGETRLSLVKGRREAAQRFWSYCSRNVADSGQRVSAICSMSFPVFGKMSRSETVNAPSSTAGNSSTMIWKDLASACSKRVKLPRSASLLMYSARPSRYRAASMLSGTGGGTGIEAASKPSARYSSVAMSASVRWRCSGVRAIRRSAKASALGAFEASSSLHACS